MYEARAEICLTIIITPPVPIGCIIPPSPIAATHTSALRPFSNLLWGLVVNPTAPTALWGRSRAGGSGWSNPPSISRLTRIPS